MPNRHEKFRFASKLNQQECMSRLRASINVQPILVTMTRFYSEGTFLGNTREERFWVQRAERGFNSSFPLFRGSCVQSPGETIIAGSFTLHPVAKVLMGIYILICALLTLMAAIAFAASEGTGWWMLLPPLMLSASLWELRKARTSHLDTRKEIVRFLKETLQAQKR